MPDGTQLIIEKLVYGGEGLARLDGRVVFTPYVLPGETVRADVERAKNDLMRGRLLEVIQPVAARVEPACRYFYRCGGCQYQHAAYEFQLEQKRAILREVLRRVGKIELEQEIRLIAAAPWNYRNRIQLHIHGGRIGYFEAGSQRLCAIDHCPISSPKLNEAIAILDRELPRFRSFTANVELFTNETAIQVNVLDRVPASVRPLFETIGSGESIDYAGFRVSRNSFFQVNRHLVDPLVEAATADLAGETAVDLYAGVGLFSLRLAKSFQRVRAVESGWNAFRDLEFNIRQAGAPVTGEHKTTEEFLSQVRQAPDLIFADPPRTGLGKHGIAELNRVRAPQLVIVSCDPATLSRDLHGLLQAGYGIQQVTLVDLFPQTFHMETVVRLVRSL